MDVNNYSTLKEKGCVTIKAVDELLIIRCTQFDPQTGEKKEPHCQPVNAKQMLQQTDDTIANLEQQLASLKEFKADCEAVMR